MRKIKIKKKDSVMVIVGKDHGKTGVVDKVFPSTNQATIIGINIRKKHLKASKKAPQGGIMEFPGKTDISNLQIVCPSCHKPTRIGFKLNDKNKIRICRKCQQSVEGAN